MQDGFDLSQKRLAATQRVLRRPALIRHTSLGFSLIELVVTIAVGAIVSGAAGMLVWNASKIRTEVSARSDLIDMGASAMEVMLRYIREISQDECPGGPTPCLLGNAQVTTAGATELDFDNYGIRLTGSTVEITKDTAATWHSLANDATGLTFTYFDKNNVVLSSLPLSMPDRHNIRRVQVQLDLTRGTESVRLRTSLFLRNFMNEVIDAP